MPRFAYSQIGRVVEHGLQGFDALRDVIDQRPGVLGVNLIDPR